MSTKWFPSQSDRWKRTDTSFFCTIMLSSALNLGCFWKELLLCKNEAQCCCCCFYALITINWFLKKYHAINTAKMVVFWGLPSESIHLTKAEAGRKKSLWGADHLRQCQNLHQLQQFKGMLYDTLRCSAPDCNSFSQEAQGCLALLFHTTAGF